MSVLACLERLRGRNVFVTGYAVAPPTLCREHMHE